MNIFGFEGELMRGRKKELLFCAFEEEDAPKVLFCCRISNHVLHTNIDN